MNNWLKVREEERFLDLSDYGRGLSLLLVKVLKDTWVTAHQVTFTFLLIGLLAAFFFSRGDYGTTLLGALFLQVKNILDGVDGSLARAKDRPSRIGRFLDTNADFLVNLCVYFAIAYALFGLTQNHTAFWLGGGALLFGMIQCSTFNYYYVTYRTITGGDTTSRTDERGSTFYKTRFKTAVLFILQKIYLVLYGWQDWLIGKVIGSVECGMRGAEHRTPNTEFRISKGFLTMVTFLGLGTQILFLDLFALLGRPELFFYFILGPCNLFWVGLILYRTFSRRFVVKG